jgi:transcriptional regulator with XRE-family HTH domain
MEMDMEERPGLGGEIRRLRRLKGWPQEHLAAVAGLNIRTVQRIENGRTAAFESVMALAAALEVDIACLPRAAPEPPRRNAAPRARLALAALACLPAVWFVTTNLAVFAAGLPLKSLLLSAWPGGASLQAPPVLLGGAIFAAILVIPELMSVHLRRIPLGVTVEGLSFRLRPASLVVLGASALSVLVIVGYAAAENLAPLLRLAR